MIRQYHPPLRGNRITRDVKLTVPVRHGVWEWITATLRESRSAFCPIISWKFLRHDASCCLPGETEYLFRVTYLAPTKEAVRPAHEWLIQELYARLRNLVQVYGRAPA